MYFDQAGFSIRCEWGLPAIEHLAPISDAVIIVDVLSFTTCVDIAIARGAAVFPYRFKDETAGQFAQDQGALLAVGRGKPGAFSLSPASLMEIPAGTKLVLPSPNGSALTLAAGARATFAGCLRNAAAVARHVGAKSQTILIVPAGERWPDGAFRPAAEDLVGAGAIISCLDGTKSPESQLALAAFNAARNDLTDFLLATSSGRELAERGFEMDVRLAAELDGSLSVPHFDGVAYRAESGYA